MSLLLSAQNPPSLMSLSANQSNSSSQYSNPTSNYSSTSFSSSGPRYNNNDVFDGYHLLRRNNRSNNYSSYIEGDSYRAQHIPALLENGGNSNSSSWSNSSSYYQQNNSNQQWNQWNQYNTNMYYQNTYQQQHYQNNNSGFVPPLPKAPPPPPPPSYWEERTRMCTFVLFFLVEFLSLYFCLFLFFASINPTGIIREFVLWIYLIYEANCLREKEHFTGCVSRHRFFYRKETLVSKSS